MNYTTPTAAEQAAKTTNDDLMTLRDEFARAALTGILAGWVSHGVKADTEMAYRYADAMMEARKK